MGRGRERWAGGGKRKKEGGPQRKDGLGSRGRLDRFFFSFSFFFSNPF
jgi:hypothetical protein